ncbi:NAD-dependent epimerase/dehydratase family protein [Hymenobacter rubidus]|uniref:NAD-dependent epimerase/dehydratase family protein n=1 Tax=Hymenobacter rubidus TaxID=1441626 RepID=UPI00191E01C3|nr:NAD-dependent epimerase/dehydratase family protein [Hymenobacter rubidus]
MLTTCIIGGAGFIGRAVVEELLLRGDRKLVVVGRENEAPHLPDGVRYVHHPLETSDELMTQTLSSVDEIVDLAYATVPQTSFQNPVHDILVNIPETVRLFEHAAKHPLRKFVWISSGGTVYGPAQFLPLTEGHPTNPISPYGITKLALEKYAHFYYHMTQLPIVCVRPANAFGEGQRVYAGQGFIGTAIASLLDRRIINIFGQEGTVRDYLHVQDMASGIVAALIDGQPGEVYNIGSGIGYSNKQVLDFLLPLAAAQGIESRIQVLPARLFDVKINILDTTKLLNHTGWQPVAPFEEMLERTWNWYVANYVRAPVN